MNSLWGAGSFGPNRPEANNNLNNGCLLVWSMKTIKNTFLQYKPFFFPPQNIQPTSWSLALGFLWLLYLPEMLSFSVAQWKGWKLIQIHDSESEKFTIKELFFLSLLRARTHFSQAQLICCCWYKQVSNVSSSGKEWINLTSQYETPMKALVQWGVSVHYSEWTWLEHLWISDNNVKLIE